MGKHLSYFHKKKTYVVTDMFSWRNKKNINPFLAEAKMCLIWHNVRYSPTDYLIQAIFMDRKKKEIRKQNITKTRLFKYTENFTTKKIKIFR